MAVADYISTVQKIYIAFYQRPADPTGLTYWAQQLDAAHGDVGSIINSFATSAETASLYGPINSTTIGNVIDSIYTALFGRVADAAGKQFYVDGFAKGDFTAGTIALSVLNGAKNADLTAINNKLAVSQTFTGKLDTPVEINSYAGDTAAQAAREMLATVGSSTDTNAFYGIDPAIQQIVGGADSHVFTLTELPPTVTKTFLWANVDTTALKDMLAYANAVDNRGGNLVTEVDAGNGNAPQSGFFDTAYVAALSEIIKNYSSLVDEQVTWNPARLTTAGATQGVIESGNTTAGSDLIVAGTSYALHGAYIDGGAGYDTLSVEMKGPFAQPKQLLNIEEVDVENATNYYKSELFGYNNSGRTSTGDVTLDQFLQNYNGNDSVLDLTNARQLQKLVVTESGANGNLIVLGIKNYADTELDGGFKNDVVLHYTTGQKNQLNLKLVNVDFGISSSNGGETTGKLILAHNAGVVAIDSEGAANYIGDVDFGARLQKLVVSGSALFAVEGAVEALQFADNNVKIDASTNTGGVHFDFTGANTINFLGSQGDDVVSSESTEGVPTHKITIVGGNGDSTYTLEAAEINLKAGSGDDTITLTGNLQDVAYDQAPNYHDGALLTVDAGAGTNKIVLNNITALEGSTITGQNITLVSGGTSYNDLSQATLSGISKVVLVSDDVKDTAIDGALPSELTLSAEQFAQLGADAFKVQDAAFGKTAELTLVVTQDTTLGDLTDLTKLGSNVKLILDVKAGATLTLTAEQLDKYVAENGINVTKGTFVDGAGDTVPNNGAVVITDAGLKFDAFTDGQKGGSLYAGAGVNDTLANSDDLTIVRSTNGYERPNAAPSSDSLTIDSTAGAVSVDANKIGVATEFNLTVNKLIIKGSNDVTFTAPVNFGTSDDPATGVKNFKIDASGLTGALNGLKIVNFNNITNGNDMTKWGSVKGTAGNDRIDVTLSGNVGLDNQGPAKGGLVSTGVETYVVTDIVGEDASFNVCDTTVGLQTLGLQGNVGKTIHFNNAKFGVNFLLEGDGQADWSALPKSAGNPNYSNVGTLDAKYFMYDPNFTANVLIDNRGTELGLQTDGVTHRVLHVDGVNIDNAKSTSITVQDGNAVIDGINAFAANELQSVKLTSANDVTVTLNNNASNLTTFDASGVAGTATVLIGNYDLNGGYTSASNVDLSAATVTGVDAVDVVEGSTLSLSLTELNAIGAAHVVVIDSNDGGTKAGYEADGLTKITTTLNLVGLDNTPFSVSTFDKNITLGTITVAANPVVTLDPTTDLTNVPKLIVQEGTTLNLTGAQFQQLKGTGAIDNHGTVNITGITQADIDAGFDLSLINNHALGGAVGHLGTLTFSGDVVLKSDTDLQAATIDYTTNGGATINGSVLPESSLGSVTKFVANEGFSIVLGANQAITFANETQAHDRVVTGAAGSKVIFGFTNFLSSEVDFNDGTVGNLIAGINTAYYSGIATLQVPSALVANQNVERILANLNKNILVEVLDAVVVGPVANATSRDLEVAASTTVNGALIFENLNVASPSYLKLTDISLTLDGGSKVAGTVDISGAPVLSQGFKTLTINSVGSSANTLGDIQAGNDGFSNGNDLLDVKINATGADLTIGKLFLSAAALNTNNTGKAATVTVTGSHNVTLEEINTTDGEVGTVNVVNNLTGGAVLTITGGSPALNDTGVKLETVNLSGTGAINFGTKVNDNLTPGNTADDYFEAGVRSDSLSLIDATGLSGALNLGRIELVDGKSFSFKSGTGLTTLSLNDRDAIGTNLQLNASTAVGSTDTGWSFDLSKAAAGSTLTINSTTALNSGALNINLGSNGNKVVLDGDVGFAGAITGFNITGSNGTLELAKDSNIDFRALADAVASPATAAELNLTGIKSIVLDAGASVQMSDAQYAAFTTAGGTISGPGTTFLVNNTLLPDAWDLSFYRGLTAVQLDNNLNGVDSLKLTAEQALVAYEVKVDPVTGVATRAQWDDNADDPTGVAPGKTPFVDRLDGDFRGINAPVTVTVSKTVDISGLKGVDSILLPNDATPATQHDIALTIHQSAADDQVSKLDTADLGAADASAILAQLSSLTVKVQVDSGNTDINSQPIIEGSSFTSVYDATTTKWTVSGNAAAIGTAVKDDQGASVDNLLKAASTINWTEVGSTASHKLNSGIVPDLSGYTGVKDVFKFGATPDTATGDLLISNFESGTDKINIDLLATSAAFDTAGAIATGKVGFVAGVLPGAADTLANAAIAIGLAGWTDAATNGQKAYFVVADDNSTSIFQYTEASNGGVAGINANELILIGTVQNTTSTGLVAGDFLFA